MTHSQTKSKTLTQAQFKKAIRVAAAKKDLGLMQLSELSGVSYFKTSKAWNGDKNIYVSDLEKILETLGTDWASLDGE